MGFAEHERPNKGNTDVWLTPIELVNSLGVFDLDPCGEQHHRTANEIYSENGLEREWFGRVWLNPPYSEVSTWLDKLLHHGRGVALVFSRTDTKWWQKHYAESDDVRFIKGRIKFLKRDLSYPKYTSGAASCLFFYGEKDPLKAEGGGGCAL